MDYQEADTLFNSRQYDLSFKCFNEIAEDKSRDSFERSDAYGMLGVIVSGFAPYLDSEDETGLKYFVESLKLNPNNVGTLLNIFHGYGESPSMHSDKSLFEESYIKLTRELSKELTDEQLKALHERHKSVR